LCTGKAYLVSYRGWVDKLIEFSDLHENNVLVQAEYLPSTDEPEFVPKISDLGEGKDISTALRIESEQAEDAARSFSLEDILPPEGQTATKESDIYAWAMLAIRIIWECHSKLADEEGKVYYPVKFMRVLENCLHPDPQIRLDAQTLYIILDEIMNGEDGLAEGEDNDIEWYDETYELPEIHKRMSGWLSLSS
jgi:hypothetical protein